MSKKPTSIPDTDRFGMSVQDWQRLQGMSDEEINAAALDDPDAQPMSDAQLQRARRTGLAIQVRRTLKMTREEFGSTYGIPLETLTAWERHELEPTAVEVAYLHLIEREPERARLIPAA